MRLGICGCCSSIITGIYDFYNIGAYKSYNNFNDSLEIENWYTFVRHPSRRIQIENESYSTSPHIDLAQNPTRRISSYIEDWQIPFSTGNDIKEAFSNSADFDISISIPRTDKDLVWHLRNFVYPTGAQYNFLNGNAASGLGSGYTVGPHTRLENNNIVLTTGDSTSGCYISFPVDTGVIPIALNFQINKDYDKYILVQIKTASGTFQDYSGYNIWVSPTGKVSSNELIRTINPSGNSLFSPNIVEDPIANYINYSITFDHVLTTNQVPFEDYDPFTNVEIRLVDGRSGYNIDDISGYSAEIRQIFFSVLDQNSNYDFSTNIEDFGDVTLFDCNNRNIITGFVPEKEGRYTTEILESDFAKLNNITGVSLSEYNVVFSNLSGISGFEGTPYPILTHSTINFMPFSARGDDYFGDSIFTPFDSMELPTIHGNGNLYLIHNHSNCFLSHIVTDKQNTLAFVQFSPIAVSDRNAPFYKTGEISKITSVGNNVILCNYDVILSYDSSGYKNHDFGERYFMGTVEHALPEDEIKHYIEYETTGFSLNGFVPLDISNYNTNRNLPKIQLFSKGEFPNCFSVKEPKPTFGIYKSGVLTTGITQEVSILFGPYLKTGYNIPLYGDTGISGYDYNQYLFGPSNEYTGYIYNIYRHVICGDEANSQIFWSTGITVDRRLVNVVGNILAGGLYNQSFGDNLYSSPSVSAHVLWGDSYNGTPGAIFVYGFASGTGNSDGSIQSGNVWMNVKIGDNIVFNQQCYDERTLNPESPLVPARCLMALHTTEPAQRNNMSGNYAAFAWFENIYGTTPSTGGIADPTGWRLHVCNSTGMDLWTKDSTGYWSVFTDSTKQADFITYRRPKILGSSDRFIYVYDFFHPYSGVVSPNFEQYTAPLSGTSSGDMYHVIRTGDYIHAGHAFAISHDGRAMMPISVQYREASNILRDRFGTGFFVTADIGNIDLGSLTWLDQQVWDVNIADTVRNSNRLPYCPPYSQFTGITGWTPYMTGEHVIGSGIYQSGLLP